MRQFSDFVIRKKKIIFLDHYDDASLGAFEVATDEAIQRFHKELQGYANKWEALEKEMTDNYARIHTYDTPEQFALVDEQLYQERQMEEVNDYLNSLSEMKIVYLFKSLELTIKRFIRVAYPEVDVKSFFKWENIKEFFKGQRIDISQINGYQQCVELKKINNCIKHNGVINADIRSIAEFAAQTDLHHEQLETFYRRVNSGVKQFCYALKEKIKDDLYTFSEDRLELLAKDYYERMDDDTLNKFIDKMKSKLSTSADSKEK